MQGIQILVDDLGGFGGLTSSILPDLKDVTGLATVSLFALRRTSEGPSVLPDQVCLHDICLAAMLQSALIDAISFLEEIAAAATTTLRWKTISYDA